MKIVCLGDSLCTAYHVPAESSWVALLRRDTGFEWIEAGVPGDTGCGMLVRLNTEVMRLRPDEVVILGGYNDIILAGSSGTARSAVTAMVHQCAAQKIKPVLGIPPLPCRNAPAIRGRFTEIKDYVWWLHKLAEEFCLRTFDFHQAFLTSGTERVLLDDGIHPSIAGHWLMAETAKQAMQRRRVFQLEGAIEE